MTASNVPLNLYNAHAGKTRKSAGDASPSSPALYWISARSFLVEILKCGASPVSAMSPTYWIVQERRESFHKISTRISPTRSTHLLNDVEAARGFHLRAKAASSTKTAACFVASPVPQGLPTRIVQTRDTLVTIT
jgi:hypothetical protein